MTSKFIQYVTTMLLHHKSTKQIFLKNTLWLTLAEGVNKVLMLILTVLIARNFGVEGFGSFNYAMTFTGFFVVLADIGLSKLSTREISRDKSLAASYLGDVIGIKIITGFVSILIISSYALFSNSRVETAVLLFILSFYMVLTSISEFFFSVIRAFQRMEYEALVKIMQTIVILCLCLLMLFLNLPITSIALSYVISQIIGVSVLVIIINKIAEIKINIKEIDWQYYLKKSWPFGIMLIASLIYFSIDIIILEHFKGTQMVGIYSAAVKVYTALFIPVTIMSSATFPILSGKFGLNDYYQMLKKFVLLFMVCGILIALPVIIFHEKIVLLIFGKNFNEASKYLYIFSFLLPFRYMNFVLGDSLSAMDKQEKRILFILICAILNIGLNLYFIPRYSIMGAVISTIITEMTLLFQYGIFNLKIYFGVARR